VVPRLVRKNVTRLDIAVDDAFFVSGVEGVGNFNADFDAMSDRQRAAMKSLVERFAFQEFHGDEVRPSHSSIA